MRLHRSLRLGAKLRAGPLRAAALVLSLILTPACVLFQAGPESTGELMLDGHDPVAYFRTGRATAGRPELQVVHRGGGYRFASEESRRQFIDQPERYVPQFEGNCAMSMAYAMPTSGDPAAFKIIDGKLYLFTNRRARLYFEMDQERNLRLANHYWQTEVSDSNRYLQNLKRQVFRVPHYKTNAQLAEEYEKRFGKAPG
jgi:YHS domain-containing protein